MAVKRAYEKFVEMAIGENFFIGRYQTTNSIVFEDTITNENRLLSTKYSVYELGKLCKKYDDLSFLEKYDKICEEIGDYSRNINKFSVRGVEFYTAITTANDKYGVIIRYVLNGLPGAIEVNGYHSQDVAEEYRLILEQRLKNFDGTPIIIERYKSKKKNPISQIIQVKGIGKLWENKYAQGVKKQNDSEAYALYKTKTGTLEYGGREWDIEINSLLYCYRKFRRGDDVDLIYSDLLYDEDFINPDKSTIVDIKELWDKGLCNRSVRFFKALRRKGPIYDHGHNTTVPYQISLSLYLNPNFK